ncbi:hypothetical protein MWH25_10445 [Natroniella acetigena]|uniref:hypothetical protein n=1 Tax=Natroniella acetigena TaxID=52004 RepID=UPI00200AFC96|nr:hypothetical protein [Natroniella acetigena]MCK8828150.1 hypothetical protein [Natroniella acetigena]
MSKFGAFMQGFSNGGQRSLVDDYVQLKQMRQQEPLMEAQVAAQELANERQQLENNLSQNMQQEIALKDYLSSSGYAGEDLSWADGLNIYAGNMGDLTGAPVGSLGEMWEDGRTNRELALGQQALKEEQVGWEMGYQDRALDQEMSMFNDELNFQQQQHQDQYKLQRDELDFMQQQHQDEMSMQERAALEALTGGSSNGPSGQIAESPDYIDFSEYRVAGYREDGSPVYSHMEQYNEEMGGRQSYIDQFGNPVLENEIIEAQEQEEGSRFAGGFLNPLNWFDGGGTEENKVVERSPLEILSGPSPQAYPNNQGELSDTIDPLIDATTRFMGDFADYSSQEIRGFLESAMQDPQARGAFFADYGVTPKEVYQHLTYTDDDNNNIPEQWQGAASRQRGRVQAGRVK